MPHAQPWRPDIVPCPTFARSAGEWYNQLMNKMLETMLREVDTLPEEDQRRIARVIEAEVRKSKDETPAATGRWARFAERMSREAPMMGKSEEFLGSVREFRDNFDLRVKPAEE